jgi:hypothetical protein
LETDRLYANQASRGDLGRGDPEGFGRRVRQFAIDAHRVLEDPNSTRDEMIGLHLRAWFLLREAPGERSSEMQRWLQEARRIIGARLQSWTAEDLEHWVA